MGTAENKISARRYVEDVINRGDFAALEELSAPDFVDHAAPPGVPPNAEGAKLFFTAFRDAFPDLHASVDDDLAEGDRVAQLRTTSGTMRGEFMGMPASGQHAVWSGIHITRWVDGKIAEHWAVVDQLGMLSQLGFGPPAPGASGERR
jgi:steroid delta-isomerase-like uncharacterized protein